MCDAQGTAAAAGITLAAKSAALLPEGGASDVGASVCKYAQEQQVRLGRCCCCGGISCSTACLDACSMDNAVVCFRKVLVGVGVAACV